MKIDALLQEFKAVFSERGTFENSDEFSVFESLLSEYAGLSIAEFCTNARAGLKKRKTAARKSQVPKHTPPSPTETIALYISLLDQTKADNRRFETVVEQMRKDRSVRKPEAIAIAKQFVGGKSSYGKKDDIFDAILQRQLCDVRFAHKQECIASMG